jgi:ATP-dependent Clp protease ATP-binding subunit ClpB
VVLLDEIEKAHVDVFNILLQILDDGRLTDGHGRTVDFSNTIVIMTSNLGTSGERFEDADHMREAVMRAMQSTFKPEFLNRIDDVIVFQPLTQEEMVRIASLQMSRLAVKLAARGVRITVDDDALAALASRGYDPVFGARPLKRLIQKEIETGLATAILAGDLAEGDEARVMFDGEAFRFERSHAASPAGV